MGVTEADRGAVVRALTEAYVDGQLDELERSRRVAEARAASGGDALLALLADLRGAVVTQARDRLVPDLPDLPSAALSRTHPGPAPAQRLSQRWSPIRHPRRYLGALAVAFALVVGYAVVQQRAPEPTGDERAAVAERRGDAHPWHEVELTPPRPSGSAIALASLEDWRLDADHIAQSVTSWRDEFGPYVVVAHFGTDTVFIDRPVRAERPRVESWAATTQEGPEIASWQIGPAPTGLRSVLSLDDVDLDRLAENLRTALELDGDLSLESVRFDLVAEGSDAEFLPRVTLTLGDGSGTGGIVHTTLGGDVFRTRTWER